MSNMKFIADLHIHSHYSRATSRNLVPEQLALWAQLKGLTAVATGDITHPKWLAELKEQLLPDEQAPGLFQLRSDLRAKIEPHVPPLCRKAVYFMLSGEISCIYKKAGRVRKIHAVVYLPSFAAAEKLQSMFARIGNIHSDGRPILGLDMRDLLEMVLRCDPEAHLVPAHIWTPWFSLLGSQSGFDSIEECFEDLSPHIFAVETGLSSDPPMNWRVSMLDRYNLISNSDAHSPENLGREANLFDTELNYAAMFAALKNKNHNGFQGTIEFFPEEGKYHWDGHRKCQCVMPPQETIKHQGLCPVCGKPATLGVSYRVHELADRPEKFQPEGSKSFISLVPLPEVLAEVHGVGHTSKKVQQQYQTMLRELGPEMEILMNIPLDTLQTVAGELLAEAIRRMRVGEVFTEPGYDGEYGVIHLFREDERQKLLQQGVLFEIPERADKTSAVAEGKEQYLLNIAEKSKRVTQRSDDPSRLSLNAEQRAAIEHRGSPLIIQAGPGSGKTLTLTQRLVDLISTGFAKPEEILAVTFTQKAAEEMRLRLRRSLQEGIAEKIHIHTFHSLGYSILRQFDQPAGRSQDFIVIDPEHDPLFLQLLEAEGGEQVSKSILHRINMIKSLLYMPDSLPKEFVETSPPSFLKIFQKYEMLLLQRNAFDFEDLIAWPVRLLRNHAEMRRNFLRQYTVLAVDEFQDINVAQYELFRIFAIAAKDVCVIGDPDQAIYGFRGASPAFFFQFQKEFPGSVSLRLQHNYRCSREIHLGARQMLGVVGPSSDLQEASGSKKSELKIQIYQAVSDRSEAEFVVQQIEKLSGGISHFSIDSERGRNSEHFGYSFSDFAVLVRSRLLLPPLLEALTRSGIPFRTASDEVFYGDPIAPFILSCLRFWHMANKRLDDVITILHFLYPDMLKLFTPLLRQMNKDVLRAETDWQNLWKILSPAAKVSELLQALLSLAKETAVDRILEQIFAALPAPDPKIKALKIRLKNLAQPFHNRVDLFIDSLSLQKEIDQLETRADQVSVLTLHAAKGMEFAVVFIIGCEENILPFTFGSMSSDADEERRLFYVGMTRAKQQLFLTHAKSRFLRGQRYLQYPSRFLTAIPEMLLHKQTGKRIIRKNEGQLSLF